MAEPTQEQLGDVITALVQNADNELLALEAEELSGQWYWRWEEGRSVEWNTYKFSDALEMHKRQCRRWEEHHNGNSCVVERVRDKYLMPRVREFLAALEAHRPSSNKPLPTGSAEGSTADRDEFEAWMQREHPAVNSLSPTSLERDDEHPDDYLMLFTATAWAAWQARSAAHRGEIPTAVLESELDWARKNCKLQLDQHNDQGAQYWEGVAHGLKKAINAMARANAVKGHVHNLNREETP